MLALAIWTLSRAGWTLDWNHHVGETPLSFGPAFLAVLTAASLTVAFLSGPLLNFADFARLSPSKKVIVNGNRLGLLINGVAFCVVAVVIALASVEVYGEAITDPVVLIQDIDSVTVLLLTIIAIGVATVGVNIILNFVSPSYDFANIMPKYISFRTGGVITAVLLLAILPWNLFSNAFAVNVFLAGCGALMGPLFGCGAAQVHSSSLYSDDPDGRYFYTRGTNLNSVIALVITGLITVAIALIPSFATIAPFSWPIGVVLGGATLLIVNRLRPNIHARTGDREAEEAKA